MFAGLPPDDCFRFDVCRALNFDAACRSRLRMPIGSRAVPVCSFSTFLLRTISILEVYDPQVVVFEVRRLKANQWKLATAFPAAAVD